MRRSLWIRLPLVRLLISGFLAMSMAAPSAFALPRIDTDQMRATPSERTREPLNRIETEITGRPPRGSVPGVLEYLLLRSDIQQLLIFNFKKAEIAEGIHRSPRTIEPDLSELGKLGVLTYDRQLNSYWLAPWIDYLSDAEKQALLERLQKAYPGARASLTPENRQKALIALTASLFEAFIPHVTLYVDDEGSTRLRARDASNESFRRLVSSLADDLASRRAGELGDAERWLLAELKADVPDLIGDVNAPRAPPLALAKTLTHERILLATDSPPDVISPVLSVAAEAAESTATIMVAEGLRGLVPASDAARLKKEGKRSDRRSMEIYDRVFAARGASVGSLGAEGAGRDGLKSVETFVAKQQINPRGIGPIKVKGYFDTLENTKFFPNEEALHWRRLGPAISGSTSMAVLTNGEGIENISDSAYMLIIASRVDPSKVKEYEEHPLNPVVETREAIEEQLKRLANDAPGGPKPLNKVRIRVFNRPRETKRLEELRALAADYPGMEIVWDYPDGTARHVLFATIGGRDDDMLDVALLSSGPNEAAINLGVIKALNSRGAVGRVAPTSRNLPNTPQGGEAEQGKAKDLSSWNNFDEADETEWKDLRPVIPNAPARYKDYTKIVDRSPLTPENLKQRTFGPEDWDGDVYAVFSTLTHDRVFNLPGTADVGNGVSRTTTLYIQQIGDAPGRDWEDVGDQNLAEVQRTQARGFWAMQEPAVADLSVVDPEGNLLGLMEDTTTQQSVLVDASVAAQTPGFFIAVERALEQLRKQHGYTTPEEAALASALKLKVFVKVAPESIKQEDGTFRARVMLAAGPDVTDAAAVQQLAAKVLERVATQYPNVSVATTPRIDEGAIVYYFSGDEQSTVDLAAKAFISDADIAPRAKAGATSKAQAVEFATAMNTGSKSATQLTPELFELVTKVPEGPIAIAVGPQELLQQAPQAKAKVAFEPPAHEGAVRSSAAALIGGAEVAAATAKNRKPNPDLLAKLDLIQQEGFLVPQERAVERQIETDVQTFQRTVRESGISG